MTVEEMSEYDSIVKRLREWPHVSSEYKGSVNELHDRAADIIEELEKQVDKNNTWWAAAKMLMNMVMPLTKAGIYIQGLSIPEENEDVLWIAVHADGTVEYNLDYGWTQWVPHKEKAIQVPDHGDLFDK